MQVFGQVTCLMPTTSTNQICRLNIQLWMDSSPFAATWKPLINATQDIAKNTRHSWEAVKKLVLVDWLEFDWSNPDFLGGYSDDPVDLDCLDFIVFHSPFTKLVQKSLARLVFQDFLKCPVPDYSGMYAGLEKYRYERAFLDDII